MHTTTMRAVIVHAAQPPNPTNTHDLKTVLIGAACIAVVVVLVYLFRPRPPRR